MTSSPGMQGNEDEGDQEDEATRVLASRLAELLSRTSAESRYHLESALGAASFGGVGGDLVLRIPKRVNEHVVVKWVGGGLSGV